jgi:hypothetical protein
LCRAFSVPQFVQRLRAEGKPYQARQLKLAEKVAALVIPDAPKERAGIQIS